MPSSLQTKVPPRVVLIVFVSLFAFFLFVAAGNAVHRTLWLLIAGWAYLLMRREPSADLPSEALFCGLVALPVLTLVAHLLLPHFRKGAIAGGAAAHPWRWRGTLAIAGVAFLMFAAGLFAVGISDQAERLFSVNEPMTVNRRRDRAAENHSQSNLRQLMNGMAGYQDMRQTLLPFAPSWTPDGRPMHGWQTHLLPFIEMNNLYQEIDLSKPWSAPVNRTAFATNVRPYRHALVAETHDARGYALSSYALNREVANSGNCRLEDFPRGASNTILIGEAAGNLAPWGFPLNMRDPKLGVNRSADGFGSHLQNGKTLFLMADGSVRSFRDDADPEFLELLAKPADE